MHTIGQKEWRLKDLTIRFQEYGEFAGKYTARIEFQNKETEAFTFKLNSEKTQAMLFLIKDQLTEAASSLGEDLIKSLGLLPPPPEKKEIGESIPHEEVGN